MVSGRTLSSEQACWVIKAVLSRKCWLEVGRDRTVVCADAELVIFDWYLACYPDAVNTGHNIVRIRSYGIAVLRYLVQVGIEPVSPFRAAFVKPNPNDKEHRA